MDRVQQGLHGAGQAVSDTGRPTSGGIGLSGALFVLFVALRLTDHIDWEWYWVASPLWIPLAGIMAVIGVVAVISPVVWAVGTVYEGVAQRRRLTRMAKAAREQS